MNRTKVTPATDGKVNVLMQGNYVRAEVLAPGADLPEYVRTVGRVLNASGLRVTRITHGGPHYRLDASAPGMEVVVCVAETSQAPSSARHRSTAARSSARWYPTDTVRLAASLPVLVRRAANAPRAAKVVV